MRKYLVLLAALTGTVVSFIRVPPISIWIVLASALFLTILVLNTDES